MPRKAKPIQAIRVRYKKRIDDSAEWLEGEIPFLELTNWHRLIDALQDRGVPYPLEQD